MLAVVTPAWFDDGTLPSRTERRVRLVVDGQTISSTAVDVVAAATPCPDGPDPIRQRVADAVVLMHSAFVQLQLAVEQLTIVEAMLAEPLS